MAPQAGAPLQWTCRELSSLCLITPLQYQSNTIRLYQQMNNACFILGSLYIAVSVMFNFGRCEQETKSCSSCQLVSLEWCAGNIPC